MVSTIDLNRVRLFVRVAEAGSFTGAARLSGLPTSSVSRAVAALERELAVRLIQRTTRRLRKLADNRLVARALGLVRAGIFAAPRYLKRRGRPRSVADVADHDCVLFRSVSGRAVWELVGPAGRQKVEVRGAVAADDNEFIREAAAAGQGLTLLPIFACQGREKDDLQRVLPEYATVGVPLQLVYPTARFLPKRVVLLRDHLVNELPPLLKV